MNNLGQTAGASGGLSVDFSSQASGPPPIEDTRIICRCPCGRNYLKSPISAVKDCAVCIQDREERLKEQAKPAPRETTEDIKAAIHSDHSREGALKRWKNYRENQESAVRRAARALDGAVQ